MPDLIIKETSRTFSLFIFFVGGGVSNKGKKSIKFSKLNHQDLVIPTVRVRVVYIYFVGDISNVNIKSFILFSIFILSSLPACRVQFRFSAGGHSLNFASLTIANRNCFKFYLLSQMFLYGKVNLFCLHLLFSLQHNLSCVEVIY